MIRFRNLALREDLLQWGRSWHNPEGGCGSRKDSNHGHPMLGTTGPGSVTCPTSFHGRRMSWLKPMFDAMPFNLSEEFSLSRAPHAAPYCPLDGDLQRADGCGRVVASGSQHGTRIEDVFERSPIRIMFPRTGHRAVEEAVLVNTAGGIAGGDQLECSVTALPGASLAVTSQAAEKVYRALDRPARVVTRLKARESAKLAWLPQETIVFNRARLHRTTEIELVSGAELLGLESLVLGRTAHGEVVVGGHVADSWRVNKDGRLIWADSLRITEDIFPELHRKALLSNCNAIATLIYCGPFLNRRLEFLRDLTPSPGCNCAATSVGGLLVARFAAKESSDLKLALRSFLQQFGSELGAGPFRVPKIWSC